MRFVIRSTERVADTQQGRRLAAQQGEKTESSLLQDSQAAMNAADGRYSDEPLSVESYWQSSEPCDPSNDLLCNFSVREVFVVQTKSSARNLPTEQQHSSLHEISRVELMLWESQPLSRAPQSGARL